VIEAELAPAKVNLALHVTGQRSDGYHVLDSLVVFPRLGDLIEVEPATGLSLTLSGPFGWDLPGGTENLVMQAAAALCPPSKGAAIRLTKNLPIASGIGGGSSDAAAALRALSALWGVNIPTDLPLRLGADVPVCLHAQSCRMQGVGEALSPTALPPFWLVLVNPGVPVRTQDVFAKLDKKDNAPMALPPSFADAKALGVWLGGTRNDLEAPARRIAPVIGDVIDALAAQPGCLLARMSGSGATCFALFEAADQALNAQADIQRKESSWWCAAAPVEEAG